MTRDYKKIIAWKLIHELTLAVYRETRHFPSDERFGITSQVRRAAMGAAANIAEGSGRDTTRDYLRFLYMALASLKETEYFLLLSHDLELIQDKEYERLTNLINRSFGALHGLLHAVKKETGILGRLVAFVTSSVAVYAAHHVST